MEISNLNPRKVADSVILEIKLRHPRSRNADYLKDEEGNFLIWKMRGSDSTVWREASVEVQRRNREKAKENASTGADVFRSVDDVDADLIYICARATVEMPDITIDGKKATDPLATLESETWIAEQLIKKATNREEIYLAGKSS